MYRECACGDIQKLIIDATGHDYTIVILEESTCKHKGKAQYSCKTCGETHTEKLPRSEHQYEKAYVDLSRLEKLIKQQGDLLYGMENGRGYYFVCAVSGCKQVATETKRTTGNEMALQSSNLHTPGEWVDLFEATCGQDGHQGSYCIDCNELVEIRLIDADSHTHGAYGYNESGHWSLCAVCGKTYEHERHALQNCKCGWSGMSVTVNSNITYTVKEQNITVCYTQACVAVYKDVTTGEYVALKAAKNQDGSYTYQVPENAMEVIVAVKGDCDGDGTLTMTDVEIVQKLILGTQEHDETSKMVCDVNGDGRVSVADLVLINAARLGKVALNWMN
jgi:hypothetical protein